MGILKIIKYSWKTLKRHTNNDPIKVVDYFKHVTNPTMKMPSYVKRILLSKTTKDSFLLNNRDFCSNSLRGTIIERYWYIYLSSKRNYADYALKGNSGLHKGLCDVAITDNKLITLNNNQIHFKYEETLCQ